MKGRIRQAIFLRILTGPEVTGGLVGIIDGQQLGQLDDFSSCPLGLLGNRMTTASSGSTRFEFFFVRYGHMPRTPQVLDAVLDDIAVLEISRRLQSSSHALRGAG